MRLRALALAVLVAGCAHPAPEDHGHEATPLEAAHGEKPHAKASSRRKPGKLVPVVAKAVDAPVDGGHGLAQRQVGLGRLRQESSDYLVRVSGRVTNLGTAELTRVKLHLTAVGRCHA